MGLGRDLPAETLTVGLEGQRDGVRTTLRLCMPPAVRRCVSIHAPLTVLPTCVRDGSRPDDKRASAFGRRAAAPTAKGRAMRRFLNDAARLWNPLRFRSSTERQS